MSVTFRALRNAVGSRAGLVIETAILAICAFGLLHGIILFALLMRLRNANPTGIDALLMGLVLVCAVVVEEWLMTSGLWLRAPHVLRSTTWMPFLFGPSIWLFVQSLARPDRALRQLIHAVPAGIAFLVLIPFYLQSGEAKIAYVQGTSSVPWIATVFGIGKAISIVSYCALTLRVLLRFENRRERPLVLGLSWVLAVFLASLFPLILLFAAEHAWPQIQVPSDLVGAGIPALVMYGVSLVVLLEWRRFASRSVTPSTKLLDQDTSRELFDEVSRVIRERELYRQAGVGVRELAEQLGFAPHYLSFVINSCTGHSVKSYLNRLRVEAAKSALLEDRETRVLDVGLDAGFNSKAAFNRVFRAQTGMSPSQFRASHFPK
ncbi:MAG: helix-turn-helix domain-containing protein [Myxococcota bacterium]